jgi:hypothetical protein
MSAPRRIATGLMRALVQYSSAESREWASAMLQEIDFIESDWEALLWALGCTTAIFRHSSGRISVWVGKQFGFEEGTMNDFQTRAIGVISGVGIAAAVTICFMVLTHLSGHIFGFSGSPWMLRLAMMMAVVLEVLFAVSVVALWRKRRPMAVGILLSAILVGTHVAMYMSTHLGR